MEPKYQIGQKVIIKRSKTKLPAARDSDIGRYAGQSGTVIDYYWISPPGSKVSYIYTVEIGSGQKEIVLHEDEMKADKAQVY